MFWPRMSVELKEYISKCDICMAHRTMPGKEPLMQHEFAGPRWELTSVITLGVSYLLSATITVIS